MQTNYNTPTHCQARPKLLATAGLRGQTDRGYKKPVTNTDIEIAIPLGMKRIPDSENQYSFRYETDTG